MRIHSNTINATHLTDAVRGAGKIGDGYVYLDLTTHSSRKRAHAFEVRLTGDGTFSKRRPNSGASGDYAATWCAWGAFLADLFDVDPQMVAGPYDGRADFHRQTWNLFADGKRPSGHAPKYDDKRHGHVKDGALVAVVQGGRLVPVAPSVADVMRTVNRVAEQTYPYVPTI